MTRALDAVRQIAFAFLVLACGAAVGVKYERLRVATMSEGDTVFVNGKYIESLVPCELGCKTDDDVVCEKFRMLLKAR